MEVRFFIDPETGLPHIDQHDVTQAEVFEILQEPAFSGPGRDGTRVAEGQTRQGRYLRVIFRVMEFDGSVLVITAYDLGAKALKAFRRRRRKRQR